MNRTGTYVAFDGLGQADPTKSDFRYYATLQAWSANKNIEFNFVNSHEKTNAVRDTSSRDTLYRTIRRRMSASKNMLVILSEDTRKVGSVLSYEIELAVDVYKIPLIIAYPGYSAILHVDSHAKVWPKALSDRINNGAKAIHIPFAEAPIFAAINQFGVNAQIPTTGKSYYSREAYINWGVKFR